MRIMDNGKTEYNGITVNTPFDNGDKGVKVDDFLQLMIAQLSNQDFMNPVDDTQYVTQLAQFATMQSMQELSHYSQTNYVTGLVGKNVTVATLGLGGAVNRETGIVTSVNLSGDNYTVTVNGKQYELSQIMEVADAKTAVTKDQLQNANKLPVYYQNIGSDKASIRWEPPVSDPALQGELTYEVYITKDGMLDFDTLTGVKKGDLVGEDISGNTFDITGLDPDTTYFVNVVVTNKNGDKAIYQSGEFTTAYGSGTGDVETDADGEEATED